MKKEPERELKYGWSSFKPRWLQLINNSKCFLLATVLTCLVQGMTVGGFTNISLPALEKRFQFNSKELGLIAASNDISSVLLICFVSFYGQFGNKVKWLGYGTIMTGIGCFLFALPHAISNTYQPNLEDRQSSSQKIEECVISNKTGLTSETCFSGYGSNKFYLFIFCLAQMLMGAGTTPLFSLVPAYIDENVHPKISPVYLGIFYASAITGPGLGFVIGGVILGDVYIHVKQPEGVNLSPRDPQWIGAWWLGYVLSGGLMLLTAVLILGFPRELPGSTEMRDQAIKEGHLPKKDIKLRRNLRDIFPATVQLIKNPTYIFNTLALTAGSLYGGGISPFIAKFAESNFGVNAAVAGLTLGTVFMVGAAGGIILGGFVVRRFNLKKSCRQSAKCCLIFKLLSLWTPVAFLIPGCDQVNLAGVVKPYYNSSLMETRSPLAPCNMNCSCSLASIRPVCGQDKLTYFSPCHAGCKQTAKSKAFNCSCVIPGENKTAQASAEKGYCDRGSGCKNYKYFLIICCVLLVATFLEAIPNKTVVLRCVPDNHRSYSLGFQFIFQRSLGFVPGPILFGWMFDVGCLFWGESCNRRGRCQIYNMWNIAMKITVFGLVLKGLALLFYFLSFWFCKQSYDSESENSKENSHENMTYNLNGDVECTESAL